MALDTQVGSMRDELRVALVLNGGVSLAIWMSGVVTEIDALRASGPATSGPAAVDSTTGLYGALRDMLGLDVTVDVIAGTSAGGLNGALLGAAVACGNRLTGLRDLWLECGDLGALIRTSDAPATSILFGDTEGAHPGLLGPVAAAVEAAVRPGGPEPPGDVRLTMTTTGIHGVADAPVADSYGDLAERVEHRWRFRFAGPASGPLPGRATIGPAGAAALARAARSSSSFPFAFEPSAIDPRDAAVVEALHTAGGTPVYAAATDPALQAVDGGVLDNSPIDVVLEDIAERPAGDAPIRRALVFVVPYPGQAGPAADATAPARLQDIAGTTFNLPRDVPDLNNLNLVSEYLEQHANRMGAYDRLILDARLGALAPAAPPTRPELRRIGRRVLSRLRARRADLPVDAGAAAWRERLRALQCDVQQMLGAEDEAAAMRTFGAGQLALNALAAGAPALPPVPGPADAAALAAIWARLRAADSILHAATGLADDETAGDIGFTFMRLCADAAVPGAPPAQPPAGATRSRVIRCPPASKLYGLELGHFASFVRRSWRANDWLFGRLDGAARLVDLVLDARTLRDRPCTRADMRGALGSGLDLAWLAGRVDAALAADPLPAPGGVDSAVLTAAPDAPVDPGQPGAPSAELIVWRHAWRIALQSRILVDELAGLAAAEELDEADGFRPNPRPRGAGTPADAVAAFERYYAELGERGIPAMVADEMRGRMGCRLKVNGEHAAVRVLKNQDNGLPWIAGAVAAVYVGYKRFRALL